MPMARVPVLAVVLLVAAAFSAAAIPATNPQAAATRPATGPADENVVPTLAQLREEERARLMSTVASLPMLGKYNVREVVELRLKDRVLDLRTSLPQTQGASRIELKDLPGIATVMVKGKSEIDPNAVPAGLWFFHHNLDAPEAVKITTSIFAEPTHITIARDAQFESRFVTVQYIQSWHVAAQGENGVRLYVQNMGGAGEQVLTNVRLSAADFVELRRKYPREVAQYLQPIFRDLNQEAATFSIDAKLGWQVLRDEWKPDEATAAKVRDILARLNSDSFHERERAAAELGKLGEPGALTLMKMDRNGWSDEQNTRVDAFLAPYRATPAEEATKLKTSPDFLLDCLYSDDEVLRSTALGQLEKVLSRKIEFDNKAETAARYEAVARLRSSLPPATKPAVEEPPQ